jgi:hypothetical protein
MSAFHKMTLTLGLTTIALAAVLASAPAAGEGEARRDKVAPPSVSHAGEAPRPVKSGAPLRAQVDEGEGSVVRPASAEPPERIQAGALEGERPADVDKVAPLSDPRTVEGLKQDPDADR